MGQDRSGFDSRDDVLDVTASDDLRAWSLKDEEELDVAVTVGRLKPREAESIRATAASAIDDLADRRWPFDEGGWSALRPTGGDQPLDLPLGWDEI